MKTIKHALLIDDDAVLTLINTRVIQHSKIVSKVSTASSAQEALDKLQVAACSGEEEFPEVIFLDINMPDIDGWGFLNEFIKFPESVRQNCSVIMLTSSIDLFDIRRAKSYSVVTDYITKPLNGKLLGMLASPKHQYFRLCQSAVKEI